MLGVLILIIPSFVLFYGWSEISRRRQMEMHETEAEGGQGL